MRLQESKHRFLKKNQQFRVILLYSEHSSHSQCLYFKNSSEFKLPSLFLWRNWPMKPIPPALARPRCKYGCACVDTASNDRAGGAGWPQGPGPHPRPSGTGTGPSAFPAEHGLLAAQVPFSPWAISPSSPGHPHTLKWPGPPKILGHPPAGLTHARCKLLAASLQTSCVSLP